MSQAAWHFKLTNQPLDLYVCTCQDPKEMFRNPPKIFGIVEVFSATLNTLLYLRIYFYKRQMRKKHISLIQQFSFSKGNILKDLEKQSLTTIANNVIGIIYLGVTALIGSKINSLKLEDFGLFPNNLYSHYRTLVSPPLGIFLIIATCFLNKSYKQLLKEEMKTMFCKLC